VKQVLFLPRPAKYKEQIYSSWVLPNPRRSDNLPSHLRCLAFISQTSSGRFSLLAVTDAEAR